MYIPHTFRENDQPTLLAFMQAHSFITLVSVGETGLIASHIPVAITTRDEELLLVGHLAKANPHCHALASGEALAIFSGPHAYISPTYYDKEESVPTWNYIAVHAYGAARTLVSDEDQQGVTSALQTLIATYEASYQVQWDSLSERYRAGMLRGIVSFELRVNRLEGKYKLSQNRSHGEQQRISAALNASDDPAAQAIGHAMRGAS